MSDASKAVFLSYASQDAEAAKRICDALRAAGVEVWFDQNELVGGDAWDQKIRKQIKDCALLIPIISENTQARTEGYFRLEWRLADQRTHLMAKGRPFLLPVVVDGTKDTEAHVPDSFLDVQWTKAPGGKVPASFPRRVKQLLDGGPSSRETGSEKRGPASPEFGPPPGFSKWLKPVLSLAVIVLAVLAFTLAKKSSQPTAGESAAPVTRRGVYVSRPEVARLLDRVRATTAKFDDILHADLDTMEDLLGQAAKLDPADASIWAQWAMVDCRYLNHSFDQTPARRDAARRHAAQAAGLDPDRAEVRLAQADVMMTLSGDTTRAEVTKILRPLLTEMPADGRVPLLLGWLAFNTTQTEAALAWFDQATRIPGYVVAGHFAKARILLWSGRLSEGEAELNRALAAGTSAEVLLWKALLFATWRGDLSAARRTLAEVPPQSFVEDMPAATRYKVELLSRNYEQALNAVRMVPHDYLQSDAYRGPVGYLSGIALAAAGKKAAAELEWRSALATVESRLRAEPNGRELMQFKALLQALLGDPEAGRKTFRAVQELYGLSGSWEAELHLQFLPTDEAYAWVAGKVAEGSLRFTAALLQLDPVFAAIRSDPRFPALLAQAETDPRLSPKAGAAPAPSSQLPSPSSPPAPDSKSVAVLAFANLSDDKANEYFSDGISEELLNVLAKVPGLKVTARTSSFFFKGKEVPVPEIAKQLGVAYVVEGSVRKQGDKVRITAQLIKAADGFHVWSDTFTRDLKDIFAVQDEIAGLIAQALSLQLDAVSIRGPTAIDPQAFELYVRARQAWSLRTKESFAKAEQLLHEAIKLSPDFVRARAALVDVRQMRDFSRYAIGRFGQRQSPDLERYLAETRAVLAVAPDLAEAYATMGLSLGAQWKQGEARAALRRALELNPNYATAHQWYGMQLAEDGHMDEALAELKLASELDPLSFIILDNYGWLLALAGRYTDALGLLDRALAVNPGFTQTSRSKVLVLTALGRRTEAQELARQIIQREQDLDPFFLAEAGLKAEAEARLVGGDPQRERELYRSYLSVGRIDQALGLLANPVGVHVNERMELIFRPNFDVVRNDPRFVRTLEILHLTEGNARAQAWRQAHPPEVPPARL